MDRPATITLLAQSATATRSVLFLSIGLIFLVLLLFIVVIWIRRRLSPAREQGQIGFSLSDLRALKQKGAISEEEFVRAKARIVQGLKPSQGQDGKPGKMSPDRPLVPPESLDQT